MDSEATKQSTEVFDWVTWAYNNRKRLLAGVVAATVVGVAIGTYVWNTNHRQEVANEALTSLQSTPHAAGEPAKIPVESYLKVAAEHPGTSAGARAQLLAAGEYFEDGKFAEAQAQFEKYLRDYPEYPLGSQALLGVAASLDAQGKTAEAAARYKDFVDRRKEDPAISQAKFSLGRVYEEQGKPDLAAKTYDELVKSSRGGDSFTSEAGLRLDELYKAHPELKPKPATSSLPANLKPVPGSNSTSAPSNTKTGAPIPLTIQTNKH